MTDTFTANTLGAIPGIMSVGLAGYALGNSLKMFPKQAYKHKTISQRPFKVGGSYKPSIKPLIRSATGILIGIPLINATAGVIKSI